MGSVPDMFSISELLQATKGRLISGRIDLKAAGISIDSRAIKASEAFIAIKGENFDGHDFISQAIAKGAKAVIVQRRVSAISRREKKVAFIQVEDTVKALGEIANFHRHRFNLPVIAVTGSAGKTTAKEMIAQVLSCRFKVLKNEGTKNNHIGLPLTLLRLTPRHEAVVLEIGTNHFGEVRNLAGIARPNIGIITNIGPAHLEYFKSLAGVYIEKATLLDCLDGPRLAILNADDFFLRQKLGLPEPGYFALGFGIRRQSDIVASGVKIKDGSVEFLLNRRHRYRLPNPGAHNIYNALAAISVGRIFGLGHQAIAARLADFRLPQGRGLIIQRRKIKFIDDSYNSNPLSLAQALSNLRGIKVPGRKILMMGDMLELGARAHSLHKKLGPLIGHICDTLITVGNLSRLTARSAVKAGLDKKKVFVSQTAREAREILFNLVKPKINDIILVKGSRAMRMEEILRKD
jgi:UDP-N-acetylmuramoyl-tripeptide--D-alanyl-D-alanine ligase